MARQIEQRVFSPLPDVLPEIGEMTEEAVHQEITQRLETREARLVVGVVPDGGRRGGVIRYGSIGLMAHKLGHRDAYKNMIGLGQHARNHLPTMDFIEWGLSVHNNMERTHEELEQDLYPLLGEAVDFATKEALEYDEQLLHLGRIEPLYDSEGIILVRGLPESLAERILRAVQLTKNNKGAKRGMAINYSGLDEMTRIYDRFQAAKTENAKDPKRGIPQSTPFTPETWRPYGDDGGAIGSVDIMLRTAGGTGPSGFGPRADYADWRIMDDYITDVRAITLERQILASLRVEKRHGK